MASRARRNVTGSHSPANGTLVSTRNAARPTLVAAGGYDLFQNRGLFSAGDVPLIGVGLVASFLSAFLCVRWLLRYIARHDFTIFAWYRIVFGVIVLFTAWRGSVAWTAP